MTLPNNLIWQLDAACGEYPDVDFFPSKTDTKAVNTAKRICRSCLVKRECLDYGYKNDEPGIWGGLFPEERGKVLFLSRYVKTTTEPTERVLQQQYMPNPYNFNLVIDPKSSSSYGPLGNGSSLF